jgi:hypothetical protein
MEVKHDSIRTQKWLGRVEHLLHSKSKREAASAPTSSTSKDAAVETDKEDASLDSHAIKIL